MNTEQMLVIRPFARDDETEVITLWQECGLLRPYNDPHLDISRKLAIQAELFLVGTIDRRIVATVMAGYEGHRGWLNYLAVAPGCRRLGFGRQMVVAAEDKLLLLGCPKINLQVRAINSQAMDFYMRLGFQVDEVISMGKRLGSISE